MWAPPMGITPDFKMNDEKNTQIDQIVQLKYNVPFSGILGIAGRGGEMAR